MHACGSWTLISVKMSTIYVKPLMYACRGNSMHGKETMVFLEACMHGEVWCSVCFFVRMCTPLSTNDYRPRETRGGWPVFYHEKPLRPNINNLGFQAFEHSNYSNHSNKNPKHSNGLNARRHIQCMQATRKSLVECYIFSTTSCGIGILALWFWYTLLFS